MSEGPIILPMGRADVDAVERIANESFRVPWLRSEFEKELERDWAVARVLRPGHGERVCAFLNYWVVGGDEIQIMNVAVSPSHRRCGYGLVLMRDALEAGQRAGVGSMFLEVRVSNVSAQGLYEKLGFRGIGVRPHYYSDNAEDALVMRRSL